MQTNKNGEHSEEQSVSSLNKREPSEVEGWSLTRVKDACDSASLEVGRSRVDEDSEVYDMCHKRRGVALIFNHINFKKMAPRCGSEKDAKDLERTLENLGFEVRAYEDLSAVNISQILKQTAAEDHTDADCLLVAAMSHGKSDVLYTFDSLYPVDMLWTPFTGDRCSSLAGKPKLFFIQACRGELLDKGVKIIHETDGKQTGYSIPAYADIMVAYSTYDGFYSWRNPDVGAWFVQAVCEELNLHGRTRDLLTLMTFVNRRVAVEYQSNVPQDKNFHRKKQIPSIVSMLTRLVYFSGKGTLMRNDIDQGKKKK